MKKKSSTPYRKCEYCINIAKDDTQRKCCCLNRTSTCHSASSYRKKDINNNSSLITVHSRQMTKPIDLGTSVHVDKVISDNACLRAQNNQLKRDIQRIYKTEEIAISHNGRNISNNETLLQDKLYQSNKNLQETIVNLNMVNKINKQLQVNLSQQKTLNQQLKMDRDNVLDQLEKYKIKLRKSLAVIKQSKQEDKGEYNDSLLDKYTQMVKMNTQLETRNHQLIQEIQQLRGNTTTIQTRPSNWAKKAQRKIHSIQQNISRIEQTHGQIHQAKQKLQYLQGQFRDKIGLVTSCHDYIYQQLVQTCKMLNGPDPLLKHSFFTELFRVTPVFNKGEQVDIIHKMDISEPLAGILCGVVSQLNYLISDFQGTLERKLKPVESALRVAQRKLGTVRKLGTNLKLRSKTERTRLRHLSNKSRSDLSNKENMSSLGNMQRWGQTLNSTML